MGNDWGTRFIRFTNMSPLFKGSALIILGIVALLFSLWVNRKWKEPLKGGFLVFILLSVFILLFGLYILVFQPQWWRLPY